MYKSYIMFYTGLEHPWILVQLGVPRATPWGYQGTTVIFFFMNPTCLHDRYVSVFPQRWIVHLCGKAQGYLWRHKYGCGILEWFITKYVAVSTKSNISIWVLSVITLIFWFPSAYLLCSHLLCKKSIVPTILYSSKLPLTERIIFTCIFLLYTS